MPTQFLRRLFPDDQHHVTGLHEQLRDILPQRGRLLDLGCGINTDLSEYRSDDREVWGTDFQAHPLLAHAEWFRPLGPNGVAPFEDEYFDAVGSIMVMEHLRKPNRFFREVARLLKPGGHFVGHTISGSHYVTWLRRFIGLLPHSVNQSLVQKLYGRASEDTFPAYYRANTLSQLRRAARKSGLRVVEMKRYADPGYFRFSRMLEASATVADRIFEELGPGLGRLYFTVVMVKPLQSAGMSAAIPGVQRVS